MPTSCSEQVQINSVHELKWTYFSCFLPGRCDPEAFARLDACLIFLFVFCLMFYLKQLLEKL